MFRLFSKFLVLVFLAFLGWGCPALMAGQVTVKSVRIGEHPTYTRFVVEMDAQPEFRIFTLADPYRVVIDFPELSWPESKDQLSQNINPKPAGLIEGFRYGLFEAGTSRIVLDATEAVAISKSFFLPPKGEIGHRFILDLSKTDRQGFMNALKPAQLPPSVVKARLPEQEQQQPLARKKRTGKHIVVIDAGHGGVDPGAIGLSGAYEKHITLAAAKELQQHLEKTGRFKVFLTRDRDIFIPLRERINISRKYEADLFVSLHADTFKDRSVKGASVYTLSERASDKEAAALADRENKADLIAGVDLTNEPSVITNILIDLAQRETMNQSARFAEMIVTELEGNGKTLHNPHRFAGFAVLKAPDVPSVLVELGFLSNRIDERELRRKDSRSKLTKALGTAIERYFDRVEEADRS